MMFASENNNRSIPASTVIPVIEYPNVRKAAEWLCRAFGFCERLRIGSHRIQLTVGAGAVVVAESKLTDQAPLNCGHSIMVRVKDADAHCKAARRAGAKIRSEPTSYPYGERQYSAADLAGHLWVFSQTISNVEPETWGGELVTENSD